MLSVPLLAVIALAAGASAASKNYLGFNSGSTLPDNSAKFKADFKAEFTTAQNLVGAPGTFNSVRLYTNIQAYSKDDPIQAFEAAIETKTNLLLGIWTSGTDNIDNELNALTKAVKQYGSKFTDLVIGISIGSEDLYRNSVTGVTNDAGIGNDPDNIVNFINEFKKTFANTGLAKVPVGHVDTWDAWTNSSNKAVIDAIDWLGVDEYPYYETGKNNVIENSGTLFDTAYKAALGAAGGKPVWVTETGWPSSGPNWDKGVPSVQNAKYYWDEVGCRVLFNKTPTFWYNLRDSNPANKMKFAITKDLSTTPLFNLTCPTTFETPNATASASASSSSSSATGSGSRPTGTSATGTTSGTASGSSPAQASQKSDSQPNLGAALQALSAGKYAALAVVAAGLAVL
ncbi:hypothetical protein VTK73DRAFT_4542 [Phialemonium thermophilum]|uniref:Glucan 1,3-beta-glucosidase n=1 Tax=Phialemonium thermophilum TaxID=223376 RepID=A0ABR3WT24_9PEZI